MTFFVHCELLYENGQNFLDIQYYLLSSLKEDMPKMFGKGRKKKELIKGLPNLLKKIQAVCRSQYFKSIYFAIEFCIMYIPPAFCKQLQIKQTHFLSMKKLP